MQYSLQTTRYGTESTKDKLHSLSAKSFGNNVANTLLHRKTLIDDIRAQGEPFREDLYWTFKCLETVSEPEVFVRYTEDKKNEWEDGLALTAEELCKFAGTKYKHLLESGRWKYTPTSMANHQSKEKDDPKFLALVTGIYDW